jgi:hypothetical protein
MSAWRPHKNVIEGLLDNTTPGRVTGWMRFVGVDEPVTFALTGDFHRDIRGAKIQISNPHPCKLTEDLKVYMDGFETHQTGTTGDMTCGLPPQDYAPYPYIEWYGDKNGRIVLELEHEQVKVIGTPLPWESEKPVSRDVQQKNMTNFLAGLSKELGVPAFTVGMPEPGRPEPRPTSGDMDKPCEDLHQPEEGKEEENDHNAGRQAGDEMKLAQTENQGASHQEAEKPITRKTFTCDNQEENTMAETTNTSAETNSTSAETNQTTTEESTTEKNSTENRKPVAKISSGSVRASVWVNKSKQGEYLTVNLTRSYKDKDGKYHNSTSFRPQDLEDVMEVMVASRQIVQEESKKRGLETQAADQKVRVSR